METTKETSVKNADTQNVNGNSVVKNKLNNQAKGLQIQNLAVSKIKPDPEQPRRTYSKDNLEQLGSSIKEFGLIHPITVRQIGKQFMIVVGERRCRASKMVGLKTIDCIVKEIDSELIREIQIIENLQRQEVEPIEEAEAIAKLREKYSPKEISKRIGRSENFIKQRTKLADLIPDFRTYVVSKDLTLTVAIAIANFPKEEQKDIFDGMILNCQEFSINYINSAMSEMTYDLNGAPFDIDDKELFITAGACTSCPFNSMNQGSLFGENKPVCSKSSCYQNKKMKHFLLILNEAKSNGTIIIPDIRNWNLEESNNQLVISYMEQNGFTVYLPDDVNILHQPKKPNLEQVKRKNSWRALSEKEWQEWLNESLKEYKDEQLEYNEKAPENGYEKALFFDTKSYTCTNILVKLEEEEKQQQVKSLDISQKTMEQCTPNEQIAKIQEREVRKKWIENNKLFEEVVNTFRKTDYTNTKKALSVNEMVAFTIILLEDVVGRSKVGNDLLTKLGIGRKKDKLNMVKDIKKVFNKEAFNQAIRLTILQQCHFGESNQTNHIVNASIYSVVNEYYKKEVKEIEDVYNDRKKKREQKTKARIAGLKIQTKELSV